MTTLEPLPLTASKRRVLLSTLFAAAFPARIFHSQGGARALEVNAASCGLSSPASLAKYNRSTRLWKTLLPSVRAGSIVFSGTWPRAGMTVDGIAYRLPPLVRPIAGTGSGLWPAPSASLGDHAGLVTPTKAREGGTLVETVSARTMWPTPTARDYRSGKNINCWYNARPLSEMVHFPTPTANRRSGLQPRGVNVVTGALNPTWVEWLMGFPAGWTDLSPLAMPLSRKSRKSLDG